MVFCLRETVGVGRELRRRLKMSDEEAEDLSVEISVEEWKEEREKE